MFCYRQRSAATAWFGLYFIFGKVCDLHLGAQQPDLQRAITMNRNHNALLMVSLRKHVVASLHAGQNPSFLLAGARQVFARDLLQIANSKI